MRNISIVITNKRLVLLLPIGSDYVEMIKGGFPVIAETTLNHIFSKEISQVMLAATGLAPNFYCKNCLRVASAMRGNPPLHSCNHTSNPCFIQICEKQLVNHTISTTPIKLTNID